jgi:rhamnose utilization protein RhaD (predicted bifunctional aldolase and dehydrogenase)
METRLKDLVEVSNYFGKDPEYVIAGGGNTSLKDDNYLWIKASGTSLATITEEGFVKMDRHCLKKISEKAYSTSPLKRETEIKNELYSCIAENSEKRPSVETSLHNLLNYKFVIHTHPTLVNGLMCSENCMKETLAIFGEKVLVIKYTDPGYILFKYVEKKIGGYIKKFGKEPQVIFLENHGVFVSADTTEEIKDIYRMIFSKLNEKILSKFPSPEPQKNNLQALADTLTRELKLSAKAFQSDLIREFVGGRKSFSQVDTAFTPDNIVYCKAYYLFTSAHPSSLLSDYREFEKKYGYVPKVVAIENAGIICLEENEHSVNTVYEVFLDMMKISWYTRNFGGPRFMTTGQIEFIDNWEVENYRRKISKRN